MKYFLYSFKSEYNSKLFDVQPIYVMESYKKQMNDVIVYETGNDFDKLVTQAKQLEKLHKNDYKKAKIN